MYRAIVTVTLRPSILDPQGKAISQALHQLGHTGVEEVRTGKRFELRLRADDGAGARELATRAAEKLLANPVMEDFSIEVEEVQDPA